MFNNNMFGNQQSMRPNFFDAMRQANLQRKMQIPPPTGNPTQSNLPNPSVQSPVAMGMAGLQRPSFMTSGPNSQSLYTQRPIGQGVMQQRMANNMSAASRGAGSVPQYINPTGRAIQSQLAQSNQSLAGTLNQRLDRRFDLNPGATAESNVQRQLAGGMIPTPNGFQPRQDTSEARNVLAGRPMGEDRTMQPLNIPGMKFDPRQNAMVRSSPYEARGIQPGSLRQDPIMAFEKFENADDFRVATDGMAAIAPGAAPTTNWSRRMEPQTLDQTGNTGLNSSYANTRMARMARRNGFGSAASFQNFMNQYNARQNRVASPFGVGATAGAMATQGLLQGRSGKSGQESSASEKNNGTLLPLDAIKQQAKFSVGQLSRVPSRVERAANDATTTSINGVFSGPGFGFPGMRFLR